ncbi:MULTISPECIES: M24 family metallopeptidase [Methanobacterium]|uniref:Aminopeptidase n=1 Tax=Methanobacterium bryantii TaxID=2161 RepID=A0A2A2H349_METBR|nr:MULTISPECIES: aminopeptidase P family protein [Methanobacterium]OEC87651.1 aminopeptidase [Methanobacterium sp. A39]PAV03713.1 aminopeptidase [Methanobacterium bryantii]
MKIIDQMQKENIDTLLILNPHNINYLAGFMPSAASILVVKDEPVLLTNQMDMEDAILNSKIPVEKFKSLKELKKSLNGVIGLESSMNIQTFERLKKDAAFETKITGIVEQMRSVKTNEELKNIEKALEIAEKAFKSTEFDDSKTENEIGAEIEYNMRLNGAKKASFDTIVASGKRSSLPHADVSMNKLERPIVIDWGALYNNYCSDTTRTIIETERHEEIFDIVLEAQKSAITAIKPGVKVCEVDKAARDVITEYGYGESFIHSTGHSVGLEVHESPSLSKRDETVIEKGMVLTVEPGIYLKDDFGVRIEDMVYVTNKGRVLNKIDAKINI